MFEYIKTIPLCQDLKPNKIQTKSREQFPANKIYYISLTIFTL